MRHKVTMTAYNEGNQSSHGLSIENINKIIIKKTGTNFPFSIVFTRGIQTNIPIDSVRVQRETLIFQPHFNNTDRI